MSNKFNIKEYKWHIFILVIVLILVICIKK